MNLLIVGATGYIGGRLQAVARKRGFAVRGTSSSGRASCEALDLAEPERLEVRTLGSGDIAIITAAISSPDVCAKEPERARAVNVAGTCVLVTRLLDRGVRVVFLSSDTVYGERADPFDESAPASPAGDYAAMKLEVERRFCDASGFKALRLSYVFSREDRFAQHLAACASAGQVAQVFDPFDRAIVHRDDVVEGVLALADESAWQRQQHSVINVGGPELVSRVAFARTLRDRVWPQLAVEVVPAPPGFFNNRPRSIAMRSPLLADLLGRPSRSLAQAVEIEFARPLESSIG